MLMETILGYKRANGKTGFRNHVLVMSTVSCSNSVVQKIAQQTGSIPITHDQGCIEFEKDHQVTKLALIAAGQNPNVAGVLVVGLGCEQTSSSDLVGAIAGAGKLVECICIQNEGGFPEAVEKGITIIRKMQEHTGRQERVEVSRGSLVVGVQCGGSDWTTALAGNSAIGAMSDAVIRNGGAVLMSEVDGLPGAEHIAAQQAINHKVGIQILDMVTELKTNYMEQYGQRIEEVNPTPGNKAGGITTLIEKSIGTIKKMGSSPIQGVLKLGDAIPYPGLWILDARLHGPDAFYLTAYAIEGANITVFSTGRGTPIGSAVMPVIKVTGNPAAYKKLNSIIDFNAGVIIEGQSIEKVGESLYRYLLEVADGKLTKSEINGDFTYTIPREDDRKITCSCRNHRSSRK
jgi:altronate dehydratase large subunit